MNITRQSQVSGITRTIDLDVTQEQLDSYKAGALAQNAFPNLSRSDREFIITGITSDEWDEMFADEDEDIGIDYSIDYDDHY